MALLTPISLVSNVVSGLLKIISTYTHTLRYACRLNTAFLLLKQKEAVSDLDFKESFFFLCIIHRPCCHHFFFAMVISNK